VLPFDPTLVADFAPLAARCLDLDPSAVIRLHGAGTVVRGFVRLPYDVLAARSVAVTGTEAFDVTVSVADFLNWQDAPEFRPVRRDHEWLAPLPPPTGWQRVESILDADIRSIVRAGALTARAEVDPRRQQALMDATVLTVATENSEPIEVHLSTVSMLTKLGFLPREGEAKVDIQPGWLRLAAAFGSVYQQQAGQSPSPLRLL
jgi:hypothetical protein